MQVGGKNNKMKEKYTAQDMCLIVDPIHLDENSDLTKKLFANETSKSFREKDT